jgi:dUTPase
MTSKKSETSGRGCAASSSLPTASLFIKADDWKTWERYHTGKRNLAGDAGFDLFVPETVTFAPKESRKVSMGISCMMRMHRNEHDPLWQRTYNYIYFGIIALWAAICISLGMVFPCFNGWMPMMPKEKEDPLTSYYIYARSSISNTPLRLSNSVGIVDSGYRGPIMAALDNISDQPYVLEAGTRLIQLCAPGLVPIDRFERVDVWEETARGSRGFGST